MTPATQKFIHWLSANLSCIEFARLVSTGLEPAKPGLTGRLHFWTHWVWCPYCRRYWDEIRKLGSLHRAQSALRHHPALRMADVKARLKERLKGRAA